MKKRIIAILLIALLPTGIILANKSGIGYMRTYTKDAPLVYEDAWDLWPYAFLNEDGVPDGYNVELLRLIFNKLDIPYVIRLKPSREALKDLKEGRSDLMLGMDADFHDEYGNYSQSVVKLFTHSVVFPKGQKIPVHTMNDLSHNRVIVHGGSFSHHLMIDKGWGKNADEFDNMKDALWQVNNSREGMVVWNTICMKWLIWQYKMDNLDITPIDIPYGEYKFMANDPYLLAQLDSVYGELYANELLQPLQNKWFYPEYKETGIPQWAWNVAIALAIAAALLFLTNFIYHMREQKVTRIIRQRNARLALILKTSGVKLWTYDLKTQLFHWFDEKNGTQGENIDYDFARRFSREDFGQLIQALQQLKTGQQESETLEMKASSNDGANQQDIIVGLSVLRRDKHGRPAVILGTLSDITEERRKQLKAKDIMTRYQSVFNTATVDMIYYDQNGVLTTMNQKASDTFHEALAQKAGEQITLNDVLDFGIDYFNDHDFFYATHIFTVPADDAGKKQRQLYYECQLIPVYNDQHQLQGIYSTGRGVTETARTYRKSRNDLRLLQEGNKEVTDYVSNINYALQSGGIRITVYSPETHILKIYSQMNVVQHALTQTRCLTFIDEMSKSTAMRLFNSMDSRVQKDIDTDIKTMLTGQNGHRLHLNMHFVPVVGSDGQVKEYFGMSRDVSEIKVTEQKLAEETLRAQQTETEKNEFMRNMSYEIRTPLTTVVGFAELFEQEHTAEEENTFIREIRANSTRLLELINNILFLSRLDARMIEFSVQPTNFAEQFDMFCQDGWSNHTVEQVKYVVENPYRYLNIDIDSQNLGHVIRQVVANAAQNTREGSVNARYEYFNDQLVITVEDTGCGIPQDKLSSIFERFVSGEHNGTGLGLSICKELITQMGGSIRIKSKVGRGTTVWISLPCEANEIHRK